MRSQPASFVDMHSVGCMDFPAVRDVLTGSGLQTAGLEEGGAYWIARAGGTVAGTIGFEQVGQSGLLRSLAVLPAYRRIGLGRHLVAHLVDAATQLNCRRIYLFSKDTGRFFKNLGWAETAVKEAAELLSDAPQVKHYARVGWYDNERAFVRLIG